MTTVDVRHLAPAFRTYAGANSLSGLDREITRSGSARVALVVNGTLGGHEETVDLVRSAIGSRLALEVDDVREHSPRSSVEDCAARMVERGIDGVVVAGGGSAIVTARAATILAAERRDIRELCTQRTAEGKLISPRLDAPKPPVWIVPSTPTTAFAKAGAAVREPETGERLALFDPKVRASGVFLHPEVAATAPLPVVRSSALNIFAMAVDGLQATGGDLLAEAGMRQALVALTRELDRLGEPLDGEAAVQLMFAALLAGQASDHVGTGIAQGLSHMLGARSNVGNGVVEAMLLPTTMLFNVGATDDGLRVIASILDPASAATPAAAVGAVERLLADWAVPRRLRDVGVDHEVLGEVVKHALDDWALTTVPRRADATELAELLESAW